MEISGIELRRLARSPVFFLGSALTMALGVGLNTALLDAAFQVLRDPLAVAEPETLFRISVAVDPAEPRRGLQLQREDHALVNETLEASGYRVASSSRAGWLNLDAAALGGNRPARLVAGHYVSNDYFDVVGVPIAAGSFARDSASPRRVVLSSSLADTLAPVEVSRTTRASSDPEHLLGQTVRINNEPMVIVGLVEPGFKGLSSTDRPDALWMPLEAWGVVEKTRHFSTAVRETLPHQLTTLVRLGSNNLTALREELLTLEPELSSLDPAADGLPRSISLTPVSELRPFTRRQLSALPYLLAAGALVLLIAATNISSLFVFRSEERRVELAIRRSLGARTWHLVSLQLREAAIVAFVGAGLGAPLAVLLLRALWKLRSPRLAAEALQMDFSARMVGVALGLSLLAAGLATLPALRAATAGGLTVESRVRPRGRGRTAGFVLVMQIAFALILLIGAALTIQSLQRAIDEPLGFDPDRVAIFTAEFGSGGDDETEARLLVDRMIATLRQHPRVESAATSTMHFGMLMASAIELEAGEPPLFAGFNSVSEGYFATLGVPLLTGRLIEETDRADSARVAVVNSSFAQKVWPEGSALGQTFEVLDDRVEVVGVVADTKVFRPTEREALPQFYVPLRQNYTSRVIFNVQLRESSEAALADVGAALQRVAPHQALRTSRWSTWVDGSLWGTRMAHRLMTLAGLLGLCLVGAGLFATLSIWVARSEPELGTRAALGATPSSLQGMVFGRALLPVVVGVAIGSAVAAFAANRAEALLYQVSPIAAGAYLQAAGLLLAVAVAALISPALRAGAADPIQLLRRE
ncbi:MAG: ABC transporter permease [Acidobacteriota bacterium]